MDNYTIRVEDAPAEAELNFFSVLREYNIAQVGPSGHRPLTLFLRDAEGAIVGGLRGSTAWNGLYVSTFVLKEEIRRQGWGSRLLAAAEEEGRKRGCTFAYLDTFSFQALPFYQKQGYSIFGVLEDYPPGHRCYFLRKSLNS